MGPAGGNTPARRCGIAHLPGSAPITAATLTNRTSAAYGASGLKPDAATRQSGLGRQAARAAAARSPLETGRRAGWCGHHRAPSIGGITLSNAELLEYARSPADMRGERPIMPISLQRAHKWSL